MNIARRAALGAGIGLVAPTLAAPALAETWNPTRSITWIIPGAAGSVLDVGGRLIALKMSAVLGQSVVIDNRTGAGGVVAAEAASRAAPDGYTLFFGNFAVFAIAPFVFRNLRWDARRDFTPVQGVGAAPNFIVANPDRPWRTVREMVAHGRANPEALTFAASVGSGQHLAATLFMNATGVRLTHIPYQSSQQALNDIAAGRVDMAFDYTLSALPLAREGRLRAMAVNAPQRLAIVREVPTLEEEGVRGANLLGWSGIYVPARTPAAVIARIGDAARVALRDPDVVNLFDSTGTILWPHMDAPAMASALDEEILRMQPLVAQLGLRQG
jgi:tripartite-type tricarboxylate transporter receptor subunit TctC